MSQAIAKADADAGEMQRAAITEIFSQATPKDEIRYREGKGGRSFAYTDSAYVIRTLNKAFQWDWDYVVDNEEVFYFNELPFEVKVRGRLTVRLGGQAVTKTQYGAQMIEYTNAGKPVSIADAFKGAGSDALKKCASQLGIALDLYDSDSATNQAAANTPRPQRTAQAGSIADIPTPTVFWQYQREKGIDKEQAQSIVESSTADGKTDWAKAVNALKQIKGAA